MLYLEPLLINHLAGVECTHSVYIHHCLEGIEGERGSRAEEVSSSVCQKQHSDFNQSQNYDTQQNQNLMQDWIRFYKGFIKAINSSTKDRSPQRDDIKFYNLVVM